MDYLNLDPKEMEHLHSISTNKEFIPATQTKKPKLRKGELQDDTG